MPRASAGLFQYTLADTSGKRSFADLRSYQYWYLRYYLESVPDVAEVASLGGFGRQYQINVDPRRLEAYRIAISHVVDAVRAGKKDVGGRLIEFGGTDDPQLFSPQNTTTVPSSCVTK